MTSRLHLPELREYRSLDGARHSTMTTDRPDAVVQASRGLLAMAS